MIHKNNRNAPNGITAVAFKISPYAANDDKVGQSLQEANYRRQTQLPTAARCYFKFIHRTPGISQLKTNGSIIRILCTEFPHKIPVPL